MDFEKIEETFKEYVSTFDWDNENIKLKYYHTLEVAKISEKIAKLMNLSKEEQDLAKLIGYLHDIGRFEQIEKTNSFKDSVMDHADNGARLLFEEGLIRRFIDDDKYDEIIRKAVRNHNKYKILDPVNEKEELFTNIIRDSDKIDIFRVRVLYNKDKIALPPSDKVLECINRGESINFEAVKNKTDSIFLVMGLIFDFNYDSSLKVLKELGYYRTLMDSIEVEEEYLEIFNKIKEKVLERLEV